MRAGTYISGWAVVAALAALPASGQPIGWYLKGAIGGALTDEVDIEEFVAPLPDSKIELDPGFRFDVGAGYRFCSWFAAEVETGVIHNYIDELAGESDLGDSSLANVPLMANAIFEFPTGTPFVPFLGGGVGVSFTVLTLDDVLLPNGAFLDGEETDAVFAFQGIAGARYNISERWSINLTYKYFGTTDPSWDVRRAPSDIEVDGARTHALLFGFAFNF